MSASSLYCDNVMEHRAGHPACARWTGALLINWSHLFRMLSQAFPKVRS